MAGSMVSFPSNGRSAQGYLALPEGGGKAPGVIVIQEWWGLVPHIKEVADRLAAQGFAALAPDLFDGKSATEPDEAGKLMMAMKADDAAKHMGGAVDHLKSHERCTGKVGSVGFCMGGGLSLYLATLRSVDACVVYYGVLPGVQPDLSKIQGPVLGHYAEKDAFVPPAAVRELEKQLGDLGKQVEFHIYPDTDHAFANDSRPEVYAADAAKQAWDRTLEFFRKNLS